MIAVLIWIAGALAMLLALPAVVFFVEIIVTFVLPKPQPAATAAAPRRRVAIIVPAHNESAGLLPTLQDLDHQLTPGDRLLVVADNCSDDTASIASFAGAEVVVRSDPTRIGKGYALDFGVQHLSSDPREIVIVVDADCRLDDGAIDQLARTCGATERPCQALYLLAAPADLTINHQVAEFAWQLKNWIRPLGLHTLQLPCQLMGTGMAFPWQIIRSAHLANGFMTEDLKLGLELASAGHPPVFCPSAVITSQFPSSQRATKTQRQRWEQGHLALITQVPAMALAALKNWNPGFLALLLDITVPPLALLVLLLLVAVTIGGIIMVGGLSYFPFIVSLTSLILVVSAIVLAWLRNGRDVLPLASLLLVAPYLVSKLRLYLALATGRRAAGWIRTDRK
jgi:cellulose synthase/poly-beta-1,6-N-acetylglucosamine synthase-like glycosyltransferase